MRNNQKIVCDTIITIFSYGLPIILLQFILLPLIARLWSKEDYGTMLVLTSIVNIAGEMSGGTLSNVRLIFENRYNELNIKGDFWDIFIKNTMIFGVLLFLIFIYCFNLSICSIVLLEIYYLLYSFRSYLTVGYRINLRFDLVFVNNLILCIGYLFGLLCSFICKKWELVYITGLLSSVIHIYITSNLRQEPYIKTSMYKAVVKKTLTLNGAYLVGNGIGYLDRVVLLPFAGPIAVGQYYVAAILGKLLNLLITPINTIILSYLLKKNSLSKKEIVLITTCLLIIAVIFIVLAIYISPLILSFMYPDYVKDALCLIPYATTSVVMLSCTSLLKTLSIRYVNDLVIIYVETSYTIIYATVCIVLLNYYNLIGFCVAGIIASLYRFLLYVIQLIRLNT